MPYAYGALLLILLVVIILWVIRAKLGGDKLGGGDHVKDLRANPRSRSEREVITYLETITGHQFPTVNPSWLTWKGKTLELDGYNAKLKIALEFSGPLHTKWYPAKEEYHEYFERIVRDVVKRRLCKKKGVRLIVVDASLPRPHWRAYVNSRLHDMGAVADRPTDYIPLQTAEPTRNEQLENELGLAADMNAALSL